MAGYKTAALGTACLLLLQGCVTTPFGPTVPIIPAQGKPFEAFAQDQAICKQYAGDQVQGQAERANNIGVGTAVLGTVLGASNGGGAQGSIQVQYNNAYVQCMLAKGNTLPPRPPVYVQPAPYLVQPAPYLVQPGPGPGPY